MRTAERRAPARPRAARRNADPVASVPGPSAGPTLWGRPRPAYVVSHRPGDLSAGFPCNYAAMREYCVSRPVDHYLRGFLNNYRDLQPHCVSRTLPVQLPHRVDPTRQLLRRRRVYCSPQLRSQPGIAVVVSMPCTPARACSSMSLRLALWCAARVLAFPGARVRLEPSTTDSAWTLANHTSAVTPLALGHTCRRRQGPFPPIPAPAGA